ncbi:MAG: hypothetical protein D6705_12755 [Deltaproteobacteria bacterium]|nr:MAG: hypothetical protein D6705_12755 [Deltaproteobacteria bacterium]
MHPPTSARDESALRAQLVWQAALDGQDAYLAGTVPPGRMAVMAVKYGALLDALYQAEPLRSRLLGRIARHHTGALREAQLVPPRVLLERFRLAQRAAGRPAHSRRHDLLGPLAPVVLWHDLHDMLGAQLAARRRLRRTVGLDLAGPAGVETPADTRPRSAYRALARAIGRTTAELERLLRGE